MRMAIFRSFVKKAAKINAEQEDITVGITFFADLTEEEKKSYHGANVTDQVEDAEEYVFDEEEAAPAWGSSISHKHRYGAVKNQGTCGSCWAFATVGLAEGYQSALTGRYTALAEKHVLDCSNCGSCSSGYHTNAMNWIKSNNRLASGSRYRYSPSKGSCRGNSYPNAMTIRISSVYTARGSTNMVSAIKRGPVIFFLYNFHGVAVEGYKGGVLTSANNGPRAQNHVVVGVGYTSTQWQMRNSWGSWWGQGGYFSKSRSDRMVASNVVWIQAARAGQEEKEE